MGIKTLIAILATLGFSVSALADDHEGGDLKVSGDFAISTQFYSNEGSQLGNGRQNAGHDEFNLNLFELNLDKKWSNSEFHVAFGGGGTGTFMFDSATTGSFNMFDIYYRLHSDYGLTLTLGRFEAPYGVESYNHRENSQYTRSYGFLLTPFFEVGANVNYKGSDMWNVGLIVSNGQGAHTDANDKNKSFGLTVDVDPMDNLGVNFNYITGTESNGTLTAQLNTMDLSLAYMVNEMFDVAFNYVSMTTKSTALNAEDEAATSMAAYINANLGMVDLGFRYEQFTYDSAAVFANGFTGNGINGTGIGGAVTGDDNTISSMTLAASTEIDQNARFMLEYRMDASDDMIWTDTDGAATDAADTITAAVMYNF